MEQFIIEGGARLEGTITPAGNKNAALPALIATLLTDEDVVLRDLPDILDIRTIVEILEDLDVQVTRLGPNELSIRATAPMSMVVKYDMAFHRSIVERVGDEGLTAIWLPVVTHMMLPYSRHRDLLESYEEHRKIFAAIREGDRSLAIKRLRHNIQ